MHGKIQETCNFSYNKKTTTTTPTVLCNYTCQPVLVSTSSSEMEDFIEAKFHSPHALVHLKNDNRFMALCLGLPK